MWLIARRTAVCKPVLSPKIQSLSLLAPDRVASPLVLLHPALRWTKDFRSIVYLEYVSILKALRAVSKMHAAA